MIISSLGRASNSIVPFCLKKSDENHKTFLWWKLLCCISVFNLLIWSWTYLQFQGQPNPTNYQKWHLVLSGIYTCVCAYRSVLPRIDLERYCLFDSQWSSVALGRTAATIAEISFACQLGLLLHEWGDTYDHPLCKFWSFVVPPLLGLAQVFCWCGVVSGNHVYHAIEESLWAVAFTGIFLVTTVFTIYGYAEIFELALLGAVLSAVYVAFMVQVDVPMYLERWRANRRATENKSSESAFSLRKECWDVWARRVVTHDWNVWKHEVAWLTGYFSVAVWTSVAMNHFPRA